MVAAIKEQMKWLIVGGEGQLGRAMQAELFEAGVEVYSFNRKQLDITNENEVRCIFNELRPNVVLNAAARTNVDDAELAETAARVVNALAPGVLAKACSVIEAKFVHISSDYVFSGISNEPWTEAAVPAPVSAYGKTKAEGERSVQDCYRDGSFIVRTAWLYSQWGQNFAKTMARLALQETKTVNVVNDQVGQPSSAVDLASQIRKMIDHDVTPGIYHGTNSGQATWCEFAQNIFELSGANPERVIPVGSNEYIRPAKRPAYSVLGHDRWTQIGMLPMQDWHQGLREAMPAIIREVIQRG